MKKIVKKNQVILTLLAMMIAVAGYLNYAGSGEQAQGAGDKDSMVNAGSETGGSLDDLLAENGASGESLVDVEAFPEDGSETEANAEANKPPAGDQVGENNPETPQEGEIKLPSSTPGEAILTNGVTVADYVATVQLNREQVRARNKETLLDVINNDKISEDLKASAVSMIVKMTETAEMENSVETLLSAKGFDRSVVSITDAMIDVVVCRYTISDAERAQIEDIVERKTGMTVDKIIITLMELAEE